jgi:prepilin-type N-terminal cleavage/methylation domain-containing protein
MRRSTHAPRRLAPEKARRHSEAGFSLVELMVALIVFTIGILSVGQLSITSKRHTNYAREETMAVALAQEIKERIFSEVFDDVKSIFDNTDTADADTINDSTDEWAAHVGDMFGSNGRGRIQVLDRFDDAAIPDGMYRVEVLVSWTSGTQSHELPLTWLMSKMGL